MIGHDKELGLEIGRVKMHNLNNNSADFDSLKLTFLSALREISTKQDKYDTALEILTNLLLIKIYRLRDKTGKEYIGSSR